MPALTDAAVKKYKPTDGRREVRDSRAPGLRLVIQPSGAKGWALRFRRPDGRSAKLTLGPVDFTATETADDPVLGAPLTLRAARQLANKIDRQRKMGIDVVEEHKVERHRRVAESRGAFGTALRAFFADYKTKHGTRPRNWHAASRVLGLAYLPNCDPAKTAPIEIKGGLASTWADKQLAAIDGYHIHTQVDEARHKGIPGIPCNRNTGTSEARGRLMFAALSTLFRWAVRRRLVVMNPCSGVWRPGPPAPRERVLTPAEVRRFWLACDTVGEPYGAAAKLLLLTGARLNEIARLAHDEVTEDGGALHLPGGRTKNHRPHVIPLAPLAQEILARVPRIEGCPYVFTTTGTTAISGWSVAKRKLDDAMKPSGAWRIHDLRRTAVTGMAELGIRPDVIELCVNHVSGTRGGIAGVYNRSELLPERRAALKKWASHVRSLVANGRGR